MATLAMSINGVTYDAAPEEPPSSPSPQSGFYVITRAVAASWLRYNHHNRSLSEDAHAAQGRDMSTHDWDVNGETIVLSRPLKEGEMEGVPAGTVVVLDGQHRLEACSKSGAAFVTNLAWGIDPEARRSIDSGRVRTMRDVLGMEGQKYASILAVLLRRQIMWNSGLRRFTGGSKMTTKAEMLRLLDSDAHELKRAVELAYRVHARPDGFHLCPAAAAAQGIYLTRQIDVDASVWFFERLRDGVGLESGSPILAVRKRFENDVSNQKGNGRRRVSAHQPLAYIIRGWNAQRAGESMSHIVHPADTPVPNPK